MIHTFGDCELHTDIFTLYRAGQAIRLRPKVYGVFVYLIDQRSRVVSRDELCETVWAGRVVSNATIESTVMAARRVAGDNGERQQIIQTLPGHGYRFIAPVSEIAKAQEEGATSTTFEPPTDGEALESIAPVERNVESMHILLVDDHTLFREALLHVLERLDQTSVVIEAGTASDAVRLIAHYDNFDLILLDLAMPETDGLTALPELRELAPTVPIVVLSASQNLSDVQGVLDGGAVGYIPKSCSSHEMLTALRIVLQGNIFVPPKFLGRLETNDIVSQPSIKKDDSPFSRNANPQDLLDVYPDNLRCLS